VERGERELALRLVGVGPLPFAGTVPEGRRLLATALALPGTSGLAAEADALQRAGEVATDVGDHDSSCAFLEESLKRFRTLGDQASIAFTLTRLGVSEGSRGDVARARARLREAADLGRRVPDRHILPLALHGLGELERDVGRYAQAAELLEEAIQLCEEAGRPLQVWSTRHGLGDLRLEEGQPEAAEDLYRSVLAHDRIDVDKRRMAYALGGLAATAAVRGEAERAGRLWGAVERLEEERGAPLRSFERARYCRFLDRLEGEALSREREIGRALRLDEVIDYALRDPPQSAAPSKPRLAPKHSMR
jgi:tetratricopeptide (TPR) repeat protein